MIVDFWFCCYSVSGWEWETERERRPPSVHSFSFSVSLSYQFTAENSKFRFCCYSV